MTDEAWLGVDTALGEQQKFCHVGNEGVRSKEEMYIKVSIFFIHCKCLKVKNCNHIHTFLDRIGKLC